MQEITVARATDAESRACLALLPELSGAQAELLIAKRGGEFAGAAGLVWRIQPNPRGFPLSIHVIPAHRRMGVGRRLLAAAAELAADETDGLWSRATLEEDATAVAFLRACGFTPRRERRDFEAPLEALLSHLSPLVERLRRRGHFRDPEVVPLAQAPLQDAAWLLTSELGGDPLRAADLLGRQVAEGRGKGRVAVVDGKVAGLIWWEQVEDLATIEARVVAAPYRGGPLNLLLLEAGLLAGRADGVKRLSFYCDDTVRDTLKLAQRCAATQTAARSLYYYAIAD